MPGKTGSNLLQANVVTVEQDPSDHATVLVPLHPLNGDRSTEHPVGEVLLRCSPKRLRLLWGYTQVPA